MIQSNLFSFSRVPIWRKSTAIQETLRKQSASLFMVAKCVILSRPCRRRLLPSSMSHICNWTERCKYIFLKRKDCRDVLIRKDLHLSVFISKDSKCQTSRLRCSTVYLCRCLALNQTAGCETTTNKQSLQTSVFCFCQIGIQGVGPKSRDSILHT